MLSAYRTFGDFLDGAEGLATNILADRLAKLKAAGVLASKPVAGDRRKVHYRLTNKGVSLAPILVELHIWSARHEGVTPSSLRSLAMRGRHALLEEIYCRWRRDDTTPLVANTDTWLKSLKFEDFNSGDDKGTIRSAVRLPRISNDVRRHRLISISYVSLLPCHGTAKRSGKEREGTGRKQTIFNMRGRSSAG